jgi:hypothetical protein
MQRTIARLLLVFAIAGNLIPLALAARPAPVPACCIRHKHHCHASAASNPSQPEVREACGCPHGCGHAVVTARWAHPGTQAISFLARPVNGHLAVQAFSPLFAEFLNFRTTRAPPLLTRI